MSENDSEPAIPPAYLNDNIAEFLQPPTPRIAAITWRRWMEPYYRLEGFEISVRLTSQGEFQQAIALWLKQFDLLTRGILGAYEFDRLTRGEQQALNFRLRLLGLSISTTKLALDGMLGGHYSGSLSLCRSLLESWRRIAYVRLSPSDIWRWFPQEAWPPDVLPAPLGQMPTAIPRADAIGSRIERDGDDGDRKILERVRAGFEALSDHAHPSLEGATQTWTESPDTAVFTPQFSELHAKRCLKWGLFANLILLQEMSLVRPQDSAWIEDFQAVGEEFAAVISRLQSSDADEGASSAEIEENE